MKEDMIQMGKRIKERRKELGLTQTDIHKLCGIGSGQMSRIENGQCVPGIDMIILLSKILKCDLNWLATGESAYEEKDIFYEYADTLVANFKKLDRFEQKEVIDYIEFKISRKEKGKESSSSSESDSTSYIA